MKSFHTFSRDAMKTTFTLRIEDSNEQESAGAARDCFDHLEYLETKLNRYLHGSDIWQINHMRNGDSLFLSEPCYECLKLAMKAYQETGGLFDVTIGTQIEHVKRGISGTIPDLSGQLAMDPDRPAVHCIEAGRELDLGGIGKGYALDELRRLLQEWGVQSALLSAGASTQLCFGNHAWPIELCGDTASTVFNLKNMALSASGTGIQGSHIVSPFSDKIQYTYKRIWVSHSSAAMADAWSTALMLANPTDMVNLHLEESTVFVECDDGGIKILLN